MALSAKRLKQCAKVLKQSHAFEGGSQDVLEIRGNRNHRQRIQMAPISTYPAPPWARPRCGQSHCMAAHAPPRYNRQQAMLTAPWHQPPVTPVTSPQPPPRTTMQHITTAHLAEIAAAWLTQPLTDIDGVLEYILAYPDVASMRAVSTAWENTLVEALAPSNETHSRRC